SKSSVVTEVMTLFRESDRRTFQREISTRNALDWSDPVCGEVHGEFESVTAYICEVWKVSQRLDVMGYTMARVESEFREGLEWRIADLKSFEKESGPDEWPSSEIALLEGLSFERYYRVMQRIINEGITWWRQDKYKNDADAAVLE